MSSSSDVQGETTLFEGKVANTEYYQTLKGKNFLLVYVDGVKKPLALPQDYPRLPSKGNHISALGVTEGDEWYFLGHRDIMIGVEPQPIFRPKQKLTAAEKQAAYGLIINFARGHPCRKEDEGQKCPQCGEVMGVKFGTVSPDDVADSLLEMFPERDAHINGIFFLNLKRRGIIHPFAEIHTKRENANASPIPVYHLTAKGMEEAAKLL